MKSIKIVLTFLIILGGVIGALFLMDSNGTTELPDPPDTTYETYRSLFEKDWESIDDWDESVFRNHLDIVKQLSVGYSVGALSDLNTKIAAEIVYKKIFEEWKSSTCKKIVIDKYINAVTIITSEDKEASSDPNIKKILEVNDTYKRALALAHQSIGLTPHFDGERWNSFVDYSSSIKEKRTSLLNNQNYKQYLSNIAEIRNGLNDIDNKLSASQRSFYNSLAQQIISHFGSIASIDRNRSQFDRLTKIRSDFEQEYQENLNLTELVKQFRSDINSTHSRPAFE